jgi:putative phosphoesterase
VRGNNDRGSWARRLRERERLEVAGLPILVVHDVNTLRDHACVRDARLIVAGHSHRPSIETRDGVLFLNPGSAGPRRFSLPVSLARVTVRDGRARAHLVSLRV